MVVRHLVVAFVWIALGAVGACSAGDKPVSVKPLQGAAGSSGVAPGFEIDDSTLNGAGTGSSSTQAPQCQTEVRAAEAIGLDLYVMLDSSGSMNGEVPGRSVFPVSKWQAVQASLGAFLDAPETQGIGVGLQFFPQIQPDVPLSCNTTADCGASGGACTSSVCVQTSRLN